MRNNYLVIIFLLTLRLFAMDAGSGMDHILYKLNNEQWVSVQYNEPVVLNVGGSGVIKVIRCDKAGNCGDIQEERWEIN